ncbi:MAG TPA: SusC/RagA family TonB-linked outer membrane protein [Puia sp.]|nr:SusC/RagA family TonB-linked outer membrane protein [Puia sp.]
MVKLTAIILFTACMQVSARGYSQTVTLTRNNASLVILFQEIQRQTGYNFLYSYEDVDRAGTVDVALQNVPLPEAMEAILRDKPLTYAIIEKTVVIKPKPAAAVIISPYVSPAPAPAPPTLRGHIVDSLGNPLVGASVTIKGTKTGTKTGIKGEFEIKDLPKGAVLLISYTGYINKEITPAPDANVWLVLQRSPDILDAPVIQAYGTTSRRFSVGSISTVDAETISKQPVTNVLLALQGQAPGLAVNATSGAPGSKVEVQLRGQNTIQNTTINYKPYDQPLFIIDGVPFAPQNNSITLVQSLSSNGGYSGGISQAGSLSPFNGINPADIESVSILKDADATSIYGTQGSNGVILITTKKGKAGKTNFNLSVNTGFNSDSRNLKVLNTQQYLALRKAAFAADSIAPGNDPYNYETYAPDLTVFDPTRYTNWEKVIYGKTSNNTDVHGSLSGGNSQNTFILSAGYTRSDFNFPGNYADQRFSLHTATHHNSADNRLSVDFGTDYSYDQNNSGRFGGGSSTLNPPNTPDLLDRSGNILWDYKGVDISNYQFYAYLKKPVNVNVNNLNTSLHIAYKIIPGLSITANMGYSRNSNVEHSENPVASQTPAYAYATANFYNGTYQTINIEPQVDYINSIGKGVLSALIGASYKKNLTSSEGITGSGYANDNFLGSINGASMIYGSDQSSIYKYSAGFARLKYVYDRKYIISLTGRRDGSSNFGPGHQFGDFGSVGAGWIFSEEKAFKKVLPLISYAKLSGSYGTTGSDGIGPYLYQSFWGPAGNGAVPVQGIAPNVPQNLYNPDYSWAVKKSLNIAMDLGFFHDRVLLNATYYRDREGNQLAGYPLPAQAGFPSVLENLPANVQNKGWEFSLTSSNIKSKTFSWSTNFNITFNRNKLLSFYNLESSSYATTYVIGKPTSVVLGYRYKGVNPQTGLFEYYDAKGQATNTPTYGLVSAGGDEVPIGDREVKYMGGMGNTFSYKHFSLYFFLQFSSQNAPNWLSNIYSSNSPGQTSRNSPVQALDYWKNPGDHTPLERLTSSYSSAAANASSNFAQSTGAYSDDTYLRLKTVSLSYTLPDAVAKKLYLHDTRIYVNAQNLLTITNYKVGDPETFGSLTGFPPQRIVAFGLSLNF